MMSAADESRGLQTSDLAFESRIFSKTAFGQDKQQHGEYGEGAAFAHNVHAPTTPKRFLGSSDEGDANCHRSSTPDWLLSGGPARASSIKSCYKTNPAPKRNSSECALGTGTTSVAATNGKLNVPKRLEASTMTGKRCFDGARAIATSCPQFGTSLDTRFAKMPSLVASIRQIFLYEADVLFGTGKQVNADENAKEKLSSSKSYGSYCPATSWGPQVKGFRAVSARELLQKQQTLVQDLMATLIDADPRHKNDRSYFILFGGVDALIEVLLHFRYRPALFCKWPSWVRHRHRFHDIINQVRAQFVIHYCMRDEHVANLMLSLSLYLHKRHTSLPASRLYLVGNTTQTTAVYSSARAGVLRTIPGGQ